MMKEGPLLTALQAPDDGVLKQEFITYRLKEDMLVKEVVTRKFKEDGDYYDSSTSEPLLKVVR
jgi:hypothetical protein